MKKQFINAIEKKVFTVLMALVVVFSALRVNAANGSGSETAKETTISYKGVKDKLLAFKVDFKNQEAESGTLMITNSDHDILFSKSFNAGPVYTDVYLSEVPQNCKLKFTIKTGKKEVSQSFEINSKIKMVEEYEVKVI